MSYSFSLFQEETKFRIIATILIIAVLLLVTFAALEENEFNQPTYRASEINYHVSNIYEQQLSLGNRLDFNITLI
jgi:hypothetical protein